MDYQGAHTDRRANSVALDGKGREVPRQIRHTTATELCLLVHEESVCDANS